MAKIKEKPSRLVFVGINTLILALIAFVCFAPIWHMVMASISNPTALNTHTSLVFWPLENVDVQAYRIILQYNKLWGSYLNTILYIVSTCVLTAVLTTIAGYVFSRRSFYFRNGFMMIISFTMLFNGGMLPWYILCTQYYHLANTVWGLFLPYGMNVFNMFLMRNYLKTIPASIYEAARIDGAGYGTIFFRVTLPLSQVGMITVGLFYGLSYWNDFYLPLMLITDDSLTTMQYLLYRMMGNLQFLVSNSNSSMVSNITPPMQTAKMAMSVLAIGPIILVYPFIQKYFVKGVIVGAIKG